MGRLRFCNLLCALFVVLFQRLVALVKASFAVDVSLFSSLSGFVILFGMIDSCHYVSAVWLFPLPTFLEVLPLLQLLSSFFILVVLVPQYNVPDILLSPYFRLTIYSNTESTTA